MADLSVKLFGLDFPNPIWPAAGPTVRDGYDSINDVRGLFLEKIGAEKGVIHEGVGTAGGRVHMEGPPPMVVPDKCTLYDLCVTVCPTAALTIDLDKELGPSGPIQP